MVHINFKESRYVKNIRMLKYRGFLSTLKYILSKMLKFTYDICEFGFNVARYEFLYIISFIFPKNIENLIIAKRLECSIGFLEQKYFKFISNYKTKEISIGINSKKIRVLWWQGSENMPELVKRCIESIKEHNCGYEVIILDRDNYKKYIKLPEFILEKVGDKKITLTHLSDIIRMSLLKEYGGIWVDATVFINNDTFFESFNDVNFNSVSLDIEKGGVPRYGEVKWSGWLMGGIPNRLFNFCYDFFIEYRKDYNHLIDYFLIDFVITIAYRNFNDCKSDIDHISNKNNLVHILSQHFNDSYDEEKWKELMSIPFSKLSRKDKYLKVNKSKNKTIYWKFIQETNK